MSAGKFRTGAAAAALVATAVALGASPAAALTAASPAQQTALPSTTSPAPTPSAPPVTPAAPAPERTLSPAELEAQILAAEALREELLQSNAKIAAATTKLEGLAAQANTLLQEYAKARDAERAARTEAEKNVALFDQMNSQATEDRRALGAWAFHAYTGGGGLADLTALLDSLRTPAAAASDPSAALAYLSDQRNHAYERVRDLATTQRDVAAKAVEATTRAAEAATAAGEAKAKLDVVIAEQKTMLEQTRALHAEQVSQAGPVSGLLLGSEDPRAVATSKALREAAKLPELFAELSGSSCRGDDAEYPNGHVPPSALCPLYEAPGESLRPAAAASFNALSKAYERDSGSPICVTDSYRSLAEQIVVKAARGSWAATPGTSEHGYGRALDLCGGIDSFGSAAHLWMKQNAPLYGWFHPSWAQAGGSLPEPWHWEYAG